MKLHRSLYYFLLLASLSSCQTRDCNDEVVCETVHRYGVALDPDDWSERGKCGQVVSMRKDGVTVSRNYDNGILNGECSYTFPHREIVQKREIYDRGALTQEQVYYVSGLPHKQTVHEGADKQSVTTWYENGAPNAQEKIEQGKLIQGEYYSLDQQSDSSVKDGNGLKTRRDGYGQLVSVDTIENGEMVLRTTYHPNGAPASVTPYIKGTVEGERRTYFPGGEPATVEIWKGNVKNGTMQEYEHGELRAEIPYVNGRKNGVERRYREDGTALAQEITWVQGMKHGPTDCYIGNTKKVDWFFRDRLVANKQTFDMLSSQ